jgi:hypothetical protein
MYRSEAEHIIRRTIEETGAQFTEEQIQAISIITTKVATTIVEEALSNWRPGSLSRARFRE